MAASTSYNQNPSSSTLPPTLWDVFLSFRGEDTRNTFTSHLYKDLCRDGIKTFMDNPELRSGDVISDSLIQAIQESKTYIVVLSENYASSSWCLDELVEILCCHNTLKRLVVPVFYYIDPSVVRHQIGCFKEAFDKHQTRYDVEKVNNWRRALNEVADFSGYHISKHKSEAEIIDEVVSRISLETNPKTLHVAAFKVGLDSRVKSVTTLINSGTNGVIRIGIHGMGGVGKTTLAKEVYNQIYQRFQGSCFLANVREVSGMRNGIESLQKQLINNVLKRKDITIDNADQGIELIKARICSIKVLVVIDDLDKLEPLKYLEGSFAWGSVVIITTRYEDLLDKIEVKAKYKLNQMDEDESLQLFTQHAFGKDGIPDTFTELSKTVLKHAGGLPLALQVFGSTLHKELENKWEWFIEQLKEAPIKDIEKNLMISFEALSDDSSLQDIFLDIACFYIGYSKEYVAGILKTFYTRVDEKIDILQKRCLITISSGYEVDDLDYEYEVEVLGMHDLIQDMGRKIARNNSPRELGKHSRLWEPEDTKTMLKNRKGTDAIHAIICFSGGRYDEEDEVVIDAESFKMMSKLKFLYLNNANLTGSFEQTFEDLRWLCWIYCPLECLPSKFCPQKLVELDLSCSKLRTMGEENMVFEKMKTLSLQSSPNLTTTPDFNRFPWLETLDLGECSSLEEVHTSVGTLVRLVSLNLGYCSKLRSLPDSICSLRALEVLYISFCTSLKALPTEFGSIESLKKLHAYTLSVSKLPDSIGRLSNLVKLDLSYNKNLETLPDSICSLRALEVLKIGSCTRLKALPTEFGSIESLKKLHARGLSISKLPDSIGRLSNLVKLDLGFNKNLETLPDSICSLRALEVLSVDNCSGLKALPTELGSIESLKELHARGLSVSKLPDSIGRLSNLVELVLRSNKNLETLPDSMCSLRALEVLSVDTCSGLKALPTELGSIESLKELHAEGLSISKLPDSIGRLSNLLELDLSLNRNLETLPDSMCSLRSLEYLDISYCVKLEELPELGMITSLRILRIRDNTMLRMLPDISQLSNMKNFDLYSCSNLLSISDLPPNLVSISATNCCSLKVLADLSSLKLLGDLDLRNCEALKEIQGLEEVTSLKDLLLENCRSLERLPNLCNLKHLKMLNLTNCSGLTEIQGLEELTSLRVLRLAGCRSSLLTCTLRRRLYELLSGFGHPVKIYIGGGNLESYRCRLDLGIQLELGSNASHNFHRA